MWTSSTAPGHLCHPRFFAQLPLIGRGAFVTGVLESMKLRGWDGTEVFFGMATSVSPLMKLSQCS